MEKSEKVEMCCNCRFVRLEKSGARHFCQRFPPSWFTSSDSNGDPDSYAGFPMTDENEWCGEYQKQPPSAAKE